LWRHLDAGPSFAKKSPDSVTTRIIGSLSSKIKILPDMDLTTTLPICMPHIALFELLRVAGC
jgi:hypothetical protein